MRFDVVDKFLEFLYVATGEFFSPSFQSRDKAVLFSKDGFENGNGLRNPSNHLKLLQWRFIEQFSDSR